MTTPLRLAIEITARAAGLVAAAGEARAAVASVGAAAGDAAGVEARAAELRATKLAQLRASIVPLAAAQRDYLADLARIRVAESAGAISADERAAAVTRLKAAFAGRVSAVTGRDAEAAQARALDDLRARYSPLYAAQRQYLATLAEIRQAQAAGALSAAESAAAISRTKEGFAAQVTALRGASAAIGAHGASMKLNGAQAAQLSYQLNDVVVSLASGQNPMMVAIQQGSQISQIYGGTGNTFRALAAAITPARLAIGALAASVVAGAMAWRDYDTSARSLRVAALGTGAGAGVTPDDLEAQARRLDVGLPTTEVRAMQAALLATGRIGAEAFEGIIGLARDFGATIGADAAAAREALVKAFADPAKGAAELREQYRLVDAATVRQIDLMMQQNRAEEARQLLIDRLRPRLVAATEAAHGLSRVMSGVGRAASDAWDAVGRTVDRSVRGMTGELSDDERLADLRVRRVQRGQTPVNRRQADEEIAAIEARIAARRREAEAAAERRRVADIVEAGRATAEAAPVNRDAVRYRALSADSVRLENAIAAMTAGSPELDDMQRALGAVRREMETLRDASGRLVPEWQRQAEVARIDIALMAERDPLARAQLAFEREIAAARAAGIDPIEASARAEQARARALAETGIAARDVLRGQADQVTMARAEAAAIGLSDGARRRALAALEAEQEIYRQGLIGAAAQAYRDQAAALADLAIARERAEAVRDVTRDQDDRLATLRAEISLIGQSEAARRRALAVLAMEQDLRRRDIDPASGAGRELTARAGMIADIESSAERYQAAWERMRDGAGSAIDGLVDRIAEGRVSMRDLGELGREVFADLTKTFLQFAVSNPLKNALLGGNLPTLADAGGVLGQLFGGGKIATPALADVAGRAVGTMTVTAGTVMLTGGIGAIAGAGNGGNGLAGLLGAAGGGGRGEGLRIGGDVASAVDKRLVSILDEAARRSPHAVEMISGFRAGDPRAHGGGLAADVRLLDQAGRVMPNYQDAGAFRSYEQFAQTARSVQMERFPELAEDFRWGGYFSGGRGRYGALDTMHFDLAGRRTGMAGGSWDGGLTAGQRALWPGAESVGMNSLTQQAGASAAALREVATSGDGAQSALADIARQASGAGPTGAAGLPAGGGEAGGQIAGQMGTVSIQAQTVSVYGAGGMGAGGEATGAGGTATGQAGPLGMLGRLGDTIGGMVRSVAGMIGSLMSSVMSALSSIGGGLFSGIGGLFSGLFSWIGGGFADGGAVGGGIGGLITGPGGPRDDAISTRLPIGSYIVNAASTARHRGLLDTLAAGAGNDNGGGGSIAARVSAGEYYLPPTVAARHRGLIEAINAGQIAPAPARAPAFAAGGLVGPVARLPRYADGGVVEGGGAGGATPGNRAIAVNVVNNGEPMRATARQSREGDVDLIEIVLDRVGSEMAAGRYDAPMSRLGVQPIARLR
ncbi:MAG: phage tail length tape measure family protein [Hyphomicrobiaceae bacterium]|nr:phage tail length tape measure family protein [Hyphomicrobiaceae bacterium]